MNDLVLSAEQKQLLSQQTIQNIEILQMDMQELDIYLRRIALENPVIEQEPSAQMPVREIRCRPSRAAASRIDDEEWDDPGEYIAAPTHTLKDDLLSQLAIFFRTPRDRTIFCFLTDNLDDRGYLRISAEELGARYQLTAVEARRYIDILRSMEPAGIGAEDLRQCLLLQLERSDSPYAQTAAALVRNHLEEVAANHQRELSKKLEVGPAEIAGAVRLIKTLNPRPANGYTLKDNAVYIVPDLLVTREDGALRVSLTRSFSSGYRINESYREYLQAPDPALRSYLQEKYRQARWVGRCLEQRDRTLTALAEALLVHQAPFFEKGPEYLLPLSQTELSRILNVNDSTVSRAIRGKYLQYGWGVFPLKHFFSRSASGNREDVTVNSVLDMIRSMIDQEDRSHPLSDQKIADRLQKDGLSVARRTVAKYRGMLGIPDTAKRKLY